MDIRALIRKAAVRACVASVCLPALSSCRSWVYDEEGDCSVHYRLRFRYDKNLKWADAFAGEVSSVHLYAFDESDVLVWQNEERIAPSMAEDYSMELDLPAGSYKLLAWCGLENDGERQESFSVPEAFEGQTHIGQLQCSLNRGRDASGAYSDQHLYRLFHGTLDVSLPYADEDGGSYEYTMYLTKDTNHIRVILQHLSGEDVNVKDFSFRIDDENGLMDYDNSLLADENISYRPWNVQSGEAGVGKDDTKAIINVKGAIADMTVARMMEKRRKNMILTITGPEDKTVASIPVIDYALLAKDYYEQEYGRPMDDQDFLDREDDYVMTFFLDENNEWVSSQILIHSWRVILNDVEIK